MIFEDLKKAGRISFRNWPIVVADLVVWAVYILLFVVFVVLPMVVVIGVAAGSTALGEFNDVSAAVDDLLELVGANLMGLVIFLCGLLLFITVTSVLALYIFGATLGMVRQSVADPAYKFHLDRFMAEGRRFFFRLLWLTSVLVLIAIVLVAAMAFVSYYAVNMIYPHISGGGLMSAFMLTFISLLGIAVGILTLLVFWGVATYCLIVMVCDDTGPLASITRTVSFVRTHTTAIPYFLCTAFIYVIAVIFVSLPSIPLRLIPVIGSILNLPFSLFSILTTRYLNLVFFTALFGFYLDRTKPVPVVLEEGVVPEEPPTP